MRNWRLDRHRPHAADDEGHYRCGRGLQAGTGRLSGELALTPGRGSFARRALSLTRNRRARTSWSPASVRSARESSLRGCRFLPRSDGDVFGGEPGVQLEAETAGLDGGVALDERLRLVCRGGAEDVEAGQVSIVHEGGGADG